MLQLTPEATRHLIQVRSERGVDKASAARFVSRNGRIGLTFAAKPAASDRVVQADEIQVYIASEIAETMDQSIIDARPEEGKMTLVLRRQAAAAKAAAAKKGTGPTKAAVKKEPAATKR